MSGALTVLSPVFSIATQAAGAAGGIIPAFIRAPRKIGTIIPDVVIEEQHSDTLTITQHPIAKGTPVSDHAYKEPAKVTMRCGFTNANPIGAAVQGLLSGGISGGLSGLAGSFMEERARQVYESLLDLQTKAEPFQLITGKRTYDHMLISRLSVATDHTTEYSLVIEVEMQEVFIVAVTTTDAVPQENQALPQNGDQTDGGTKQPQKTIFKSLFNGSLHDFLHGGSFPSLWH